MSEPDKNKAEKLDLNSVDRFRKVSKRLALEQYGSCEVPAGCGGVVMRWVREDTGRTGLVTAISSGQTQWFIAGQQTESSREFIPFGRHVFSLVTEHSEREPFHLGLSIETGEEARVHMSATSSLVEFSVHTKDDGSWLYTLREPEGDWHSLDYDDSEWRPLGKRSYKPSKDQNWDKYRIERLEKKGGCLIGLDKHVKRVWVRRVFEFKRPERRR